MGDTQRMRDTMLYTHQSVVCNRVLKLEKPVVVVVVSSSGTPRYRE